GAPGQTSRRARVHAEPRRKGATMSRDPAPGWTVADLAKRYRVGKDRIRTWIKRGELAAINTSLAKCGRPRFVVTDDALAAFERGHTAAQPPRPERRKRTQMIDYYPD